MAKLENVKVIDMANGEVTKIEYEGEEYTITEEKAQVGDILFNIKEMISSQLADSYYKVVKVDDFARVEDERGELHGWRHHTQGENFKVFRKLDVEFRKITRDPQVGDFLKFTNADELPPYLSAGRYYEIVDIDYNGDPQIDDDEGDRCDTFGHSFTVFEKTMEEDIKIGDTVKLTIKDGGRPYYGWGAVENGEIGEVVRIDDDGLIKVDFPSQSNWSALGSELSVLMRDSLYNKYVKVAGGDEEPFDCPKGYAGWGKSGQGLVAFGSIGRVVEETDKGVYVDFEGKALSVKGNAIEHRFFLRDGEFEEVADAGELKVGGYARVISLAATDECRGLPDDIEVGEIVKLIATSNKPGATKGFKVEKLDGHIPDDNNIVAADLVPVTDEDVEDDVFAKLGRKPGEFKDGDVVRVLEKSHTGSRNLPGDIGIVESSNLSGYFVNVESRNKPGANGNHHISENLELVAPVDYRVDSRVDEDA